MYNASVAEVFDILATSKSCGNIHCSYQHYQSGKITLKVLVLIIYFSNLLFSIIIAKSGICLW